MAHFSPAFLKFFDELAKNNSTEWFNDNRKTYEKEVKKPFAAFVEEMIARISERDPEVQITPSDAIGRINKDIRFSKDKTPYNLHVSANISKYGRKNKAYPGFYFQLGHGGIEIFGGAYMVEKEELEAIRQLIATDHKALDKALKNKSFQEHFGELKGDKAKRLDPQFGALVDERPLIANKQFYYSATLPKKLITSDTLADELMQRYEAAAPVNSFLKKAFDSSKR
jgi:uncharacterized protein (TIGR02453 family)